MTAAVPDPSFRDQLARWVPHTMGCFAHRTDDVGMDYRCICFHDGLVDRLAPKLEAHIAAEVEARVQAAADQREIETLTRLADAWDENASRWYYEHRHTHPNGIEWVGGFDEGWGEGARLLRARAAALASPAPATPGDA
jgi:hypothetical protein